MARAPRAASCAALRCAEHGTFRLTDGIWRFLTADRLAFYRRFLQEYGTVRRTEGRGSPDAEYFRALPFQDRSGRLPEPWRIRAASYRAFLARVLVPLERESGRSLDVLDLGAGNGWLSYRLAERGHRVAALDLGDDSLDGLGAHVWYAGGGAPPFTPVQAEFDRLPLLDECADLVIFNSSLHYATDFRVTLAEALRVLRPAGAVVILDSPVYAEAASGRAMVREREAFFQERHGFPSNALASENYLTPDRLACLAGQLGVSWRVLVPWLGWRWALRPWVARLSRRREPSAFWLLVGTRASGGERPARGHQPPQPPRGPVPALWRALLRARYLLFQRARQRGPSWERVLGRMVLVLPGVFNPRLLRTGEFLARQLEAGLVPPGASVLDMGTGSGIGALAAAERAGRVLAVDVNPQAVRCARVNALLHGLEGKIEVREGDLFGPLRPGERFDLVLFNPPFYRGVPKSPADAAWRGSDVAERFAGGLAARLSAQGHALVVLSSDGDARGWLDAFRAAGLEVGAVAERDLLNEVLVLYRVGPP